MRKAVYDLVEAADYDLVVTVIVDDDGKKLPIEFAKWDAITLRDSRMCDSVTA